MCKILKSGGSRYWCKVLIALCWRICICPPLFTLRRIGGSGIDIRSKSRVSIRRHHHHICVSFSGQLPGVKGKSPWAQGLLSLFAYHFYRTILKIDLHACISDNWKTGGGPLGTTKMELRWIKHRASSRRRQWSHSIVSGMGLQQMRSLYEKKHFTVTLLIFLFLFSVPRLFSRTHSEVATTFWYIQSQLIRIILHMLLAFCAIPHKRE